MDDETRDAMRAAVDRLAATPDVPVVIVTCAGCGGRFSAIRPRRGATRRYCTVVCRDDAARARKRDIAVTSGIDMPADQWISGRALTADQASREG